MDFRNKTIKLIAVTSLLLLLSGCSVWENFTTYFNLYFNTASLFEDAETEILSQKRDLFSNDPLLIPGTAKQALIKVIEKSSKLLQFYSTSSYVDEALMMLGKSFYYQNNYQKSKRKFEELLATDIDDDEVITETNLWIAKNLFELRDFNQALKLIGEVRNNAVEKGYDDIIKDSYVQEIKYRIKEKDYSLAISLANEFAEAYDDDAVRAQIYYELGNLYTLIDEKDNAILAYQKVFDNEPDFDLEVSATIKYANALRDAGQTEKALEVFEDIRTKDKFAAAFNEIDFQIGKTLVLLGKYNEAYDKFRMVDTTYKNTPFASASNFEMGELYRTRFLNYDSAGYYFSKSAAANAPADYLEKAKSNNLLFAKYSKLRKEINKFDKQLYYSQHPDIFLTDSSAYVADSLKLLEDYLAKKEMQDIWKGADTMFTKNNLIIPDSVFVKDSIFVRDSLVKIDSLIQIGEFNEKDTVGLKKSMLDSLKQKHIADLKDLKNPNNIFNKNQSTIKLDSVKFKRNPPQKLKISIDSAKTILAKNTLELGNLFLTDLDVPDSSYTLYKKILNDYQSPVYYPNTLYAMGSYYLTINEKQKADSLFNIIYNDYRNRTIVNAAANKLNKPLIDLNFDPAKDQYASAEDLMLAGDYSQSLNKFFSIYQEYPKSNVAPQALFASGWILENDLFLPDSAASIYDTLIAKYPTSLYVKNVAKKVTAYKQEKARIKKALEDSLKAVTQTGSDSTIVALNTEDNQENLSEDQTGIEITDNSAGNETIEIPIEKTDENQNPVGINPKKKLEPLWDPRRHFN
ncbi:MAG TPA: tetratricopeptide repeat protein [Ignavibacteriaceae bacterium]